MQRRNHFLQGGQSPLLNLPEDLLILILKYSEKHNLRQIARISLRFHYIVNKVFRNTLYGRALKFYICQKERVNAFKTANFEIVKILWQKINECRDKFPKLNETLKYKTLKTIYEKRQKSYYGVTSSLSTTPNHITNKRGYTNVAII